MTTFLQVMNEKLKKKKHLGMILSSHLEFRVKWYPFLLLLQGQLTKNAVKTQVP